MSPTFDRGGGDVVTYDLDSVEWIAALADYFRIGIGIFSDISMMDTDLCCVNVGIGYEFAHSKDSYACIKTMNRQIAMFKQFYAEYKDVKFVQDKKPEHNVFDYYEAGECELCGLLTSVDYIFGHIICEQCFEDMLAEYIYIK